MDDPLPGTVTPTPRSRPSCHVSVKGMASCNPSPTVSSINRSLYHQQHLWQPYPLMRWYRDNQIGYSLIVLSLLVSGAALAPPSAQSYFHYFILPAYPIPPHQVASHPPNATSPGPATNLYDKGPWDIAYVAFGIVLWTLLRAVTIDQFLKPLARKLDCNPSHIDRFGEQGWLLLYYSISWPIGMYFAYHSPWWCNTAQFWIDYPHVYLSSQFKSYYLLQLSFWIQQLLVIHIEKPRKDHMQMLLHHTVTCSLIISSYYCNFTRIGAAILVTMDVGDIFLSAAKCFNYLRWRTICDTTFVIFVAVWIYSRHYVYNIIIASIWTVAPYITNIDAGIDPSVGNYLSRTTLSVFTILLGILQLLLLIWVFMIFRVIVKVIYGGSAEDNRSDEETESEVIIKDAPDAPKKLK